MPSFHLSIAIAAPAERVWRALCDPAQVVRWDATVVAALDAPPGYPRPGQHVRWRCRTRPFRILHDRPQDVEPARRLRSLLTHGLYHMDETYSLRPSGASSCQLELDVVLSPRVPMLAFVIARLYPAAAVRDGFDASLQSLKRHSEAEA